MTLRSGLLIFSATATLIRAEHRRLRELDRQLSLYDTPGEERELTAMLKRYPDGRTREAWSLIAMQKRTDNKVQPALLPTVVSPELDCGEPPQRSSTSSGDRQRPGDG